ncbi:hypothetical protein J6590_006993 [Homalodisca vitripennis]|nr:hypothetical protein J6590_006993 [Homalodisca vitripennis]
MEAWAADLLLQKQTSELRPRREIRALPCRKELTDYLVLQEPSGHGLRHTHAESDGHNVEHITAWGRPGGSGPLYCGCLRVHTCVSMSQHAGGDCLFCGDHGNIPVPPKNSVELSAAENGTLRSGGVLVGVTLSTRCMR